GIARKRQARSPQVVPKPELQFEVSDLIAPASPRARSCKFPGRALHTGTARVSPARRGVEMMSHVMRKPRTQNRMVPARKRALYVEMLETRALLSAATWPGLISPVASSAGIGTLDQAQNLGDLSALPSL